MEPTNTTELAGTVQETTPVLGASQDLGPRVARCEQDDVDLRGRVRER
jgi:hypothetical protein